MSVCFECHLPIDGDVFISKVWDEELFEPMRQPFHLECLENDKRPKEHRVCETCGQTGQDSNGKYPSPFVQPYIQHSTCVDWDNIRKYKE